MSLKASFREKRPAREEGRILAQAVAGEEIGRYLHLLVEHRPRRVADEQHRGLGIERFSKLLLRSVEAEAGQTEIEGLVRQFEELAHVLEAVIELLAHADVLRSLSRKNDADLLHDCLFFDEAASLISSRAITFLWIWFVPSYIWRIFASLIIFSMGYSRMYP